MESAIDVYNFQSYPLLKWACSTVDICGAILNLNRNYA